MILFLNFTLFRIKTIIIPTTFSIKYCISRGVLSMHHGFYFIFQPYHYDQCCIAQHQANCSQVVYGR